MTLMVRSTISRLIEPSKRVFGRGYVKGMENLELRQPKDAVTHPCLEVARSRSRGESKYLEIFGVLLCFILLTQLRRNGYKLLQDI